METSQGERLAVLETSVKAHEKHCEERAERTAKAVDDINQRMEREANERKEQAARIHQRCDDTATSMAKLENTIGGLPATIAAQIQISQQANKLWTYGLIIAAGGSIAAMLVQKFMA